MKKVMFILAFFAWTAAGLFAQSQLSVDIDDPVYKIIELGELKGVLNRLSSVKPYTRSQISRYLEIMKKKEGAFSKEERRLLDSFYDRYNRGPNTVLYEAERGIINFQAGVDFESNNSVNLNEITHPELNNVIEAYVLGGIGEHFSYMGSVGFTQDKENSIARAPYNFDKNWTSARYKQVTPLDLSWMMDQDIAASFAEDDIILRFSKHKRNWGIGSQSLTLSEHAASFPAFEVQGRFADVFNFSHVYGTLSYGKVENDYYSYNRNYNPVEKVNNPNNGPDDTITSNDPNAPDRTYNKNIILQKFEFFPTDWLTFGITGSLISPQTFNIGYLSPFLVTFLNQNSYGDYSNSGIEVNFNAKIPKVGQVYGSLFTDELTVYNPSTFFKDIDNMVALQGGTKLLNPWMPLSWLTLQYTKVEPFVYAHVPVYSPDHHNPVDVAYTNDGRPLATYLPPNSDEILVRFECVPMPNLTAVFRYQLIRHGTNKYDPSDPSSNTKVYGDPNIGIDYKNVGRDNYDSKNFLKDGVYDWNHIISLDGIYSFPTVPVRLKLGYSFAYTTWDVNDTGEAKPDDVFRNIIKASVKVSY